LPHFANESPSPPEIVHKAEEVASVRCLRYVDLSKRSDRRLVLQAINSNWPVPEHLCDTLVEGLAKQFDSVNDRSAILIVETFVAMSALDQCHDLLGRPLQPYRRWRRTYNQWTKGMRRD